MLDSVFFGTNSKFACHDLLFFCINSQFTFPQFEIINFKRENKTNLYIILRQTFKGYCCESGTWLFFCCESGTWLLYCCESGMWLLFCCESGTWLPNCCEMVTWLLYLAVTWQRTELRALKTLNLILAIFCLSCGNPKVEWLERFSTSRIWFYNFEKYHILCFMNRLMLILR